MKKKIISLLVLLSAFLITSNVSAKEISKDDIPNGSYIIGSHMFTREASGDYKGTLTVEYIMLASKTIDSDNINDMTIYLKNSRGKWVNALTNAEVSVPDTWEIYYENAVMTSLPKPELVKSCDSRGCTLRIFQSIYLEAISFSFNTEIDFDVYEKDGYNYRLIDTGMMIGAVGKDAYVYFSNETKTYVAKIWYMDKNNEKVYSDYSDEITINSDDADISLEVDYPQGNFYENGIYNFYTKLNLHGYHDYKAWTLYEVELDSNNNVINKTAIGTEYIEAPIKLEIEAGKSKNIMVGLCSNVPDENSSNCEELFIKVDKIDTKEFINSPILSTNIDKTVYDEAQQKLKVGLMINYKDYYLPTLNNSSLIGKELIQGVEIKRVLENGTYEAFDDVSFDSNYLEQSKQVVLAIGESDKFVARVYIEDTQGNKYYSDYSEELVVDTNDIPVIVTGGINADPNTGHPRYYYDFVGDMYQNYSNVEVYSLKDNGKWELYNDIALDSVGEFVITTNFDKIKIRLYKVVQGQKIYSNEYIY